MCIRDSARPQRVIRVGEARRGDDDDLGAPRHPGDGVERVGEQGPAPEVDERLGDVSTQAATGTGCDDDDADAARGSVGVGHVSVEWA